MQQIQKPFAQSCENNKDPILAQLRRCFSATQKVLEIGSGTGQHAVYFSQHLAHITWYPTDQKEYLPGIQLWLDEANSSNLEPPRVLDVTQQPWPVSEIDGVYSANTAHIMSWPMVEKMFAGIGECLIREGRLCLYGPFNYGGDYSSDSNARFDIWLKQQDPFSGIRDFEEVDHLASTVGLKLLEDIKMPANNRLLIWQKLD